MIFGCLLTTISPCSCALPHREPVFLFIYLYFRRCLSQLYHNTHLTKSACYSKPRFDSTEFIVLHFAGEVYMPMLLLILVEMVLAASGVGVAGFVALLACGSSGCLHNEHTLLTKSKEKAGVLSGLSSTANINRLSNHFVLFSCISIACFSRAFFSFCSRVSLRAHPALCFPSPPPRDADGPVPYRLFVFALT